MRQLIVSFVLLCWIQPGLAAQDEQAYLFKVMLDDREIGFHRFDVKRTDDLEIVDIQAEFKVTFLAIPFYRYRHVNQETWRDGCLLTIRSQTNDNGDEFKVDGQRDDNGFSLATLDQSVDLDQTCVMTFAYWDMKMLEQTQLLNAQTGEYLPVEVNFEGDETLKLNESAVLAKRYRLLSPENDVDITLWYDRATRRWLSLASRMPDDRVIRYWPTTEEVAMQSVQSTAEPSGEAQR